MVILLFALSLFVNKRLGSFSGYQLIKKVFFPCSSRCIGFCWLCIELWRQLNSVVYSIICFLPASTYIGEWKEMYKVYLPKRTLWTVHLIIYPFFLFFVFWFFFFFLQSSKLDRFSVINNLPLAIDFSKSNLIRGKKILVCCHTGEL